MSVEFLVVSAGSLDRPKQKWCHHQGGPWPVPHDAMVDSRSPVDGFEWLDAFGQRAADQVLNNREAEKVVAGTCRLVRREHGGDRGSARHRSRHRRLHSIVLCGEPDQRWRCCNWWAKERRERWRRASLMLPPLRGRALLCGQLK
jgi:hypothetical protein